jgi:hypothetical protein
VTPSDFFITASVDGCLKFWKKQQASGTVAADTLAGVLCLSSEQHHRQCQNDVVSFGRDKHILLLGLGLQPTAVVLTLRFRCSQLQEGIEFVKVYRAHVGAVDGQWSSSIARLSV